MAADEPLGLRDLQHRFATAMSAPIRIADDGDYELAVERYPVQLVADMEERHGRSGAERLGVYNQQYWFRLLTVMQEEYPLLCAILGLVEFNRMVVAFLDDHPSNSPLLRHLSDPLHDWLDGDHGWNRAELRECARLEHHYIHAFDAAPQPVLDPTQVEPTVLLTQSLTLQPHLHLFHETWNLVDNRRRVRRDQAIELARGEAWWAIYRAHDQSMVAHTLGPMQHDLLASLSAGDSLQAACVAVQSRADAEQVAFLVDNIQQWFAGWMAMGWFCAE